MINGVILQKLQTLDEVLAELRSLGNVSVDRLNDDWQMRRAIERDLQIAVEIVIDVCQRILSLAGQTPATTSGDVITRCIQLGALTDEDAYRKMVQVHNFIVHRDERVDLAILADMVNCRLGDFEQFRDEVLAYVQR